MIVRMVQEWTTGPGRCTLDAGLGGARRGSGLSFDGNVIPGLFHCLKRDGIRKRHRVGDVVADGIAAARFHP